MSPFFWLAIEIKVNINLITVHL